MCFILRLDRGRLVNHFSSREIKRQLYMTERRIRYASSLALMEAAVYFMSGSLYSCVEEEGFAYKNSAVDHQTLATRIHRLIEKAHPVAEWECGAARLSL